MNKKFDNIVFYDGDCGFCNASVGFILKKRKKNFFYAALQSEWAQEKLAEYDITVDLETIYFIRQNKLYDRSSAALQICKGLKGAYPLMMTFWIIPKFLRDLVYNAIAKRRHRIKQGHCVIPSEQEKQFFV